ncbi:MAG: RecQ family ATP-dependent DNA helicase [Mediterranea sp.]|jgi:ATP-dependent DNA helicase RecQ|nr:RecQ family ATP-dependent DNA helicase [Mediterranea sp.]
MQPSDILLHYWGYSGFRPLQEEIINSIWNGNDTLGLMPTGGGKSITFQVPALGKEGLCLVITPLIALMKDQVQNLKKRDIKAAAVYSGMTHQEIITALENCIFGNYKFLYVSPERLDTEIFRAKLHSMKVSMIAVDESHCISQWGYDFRPAYLKIMEIRKLLPGVPVLALTATATPAVIKDIQEKLQFTKENVFRISFERKNLAYMVRKADNKTADLLYLLNKIPGSAIVYVRSRQKTKDIVELLLNEGIAATYYHAGLNNDDKDSRQKQWHEGKCRVIVATNAFGMGIDKPDVRIVIHLDVPDSLEAYFQEAGRAGRDGEQAYAVILYADSDKTKLNKQIADTFPEKEYIKEVYEHLNYYYQMAMGDGFGCMYEFNLEEFCYKFRHFPTQTNSALKILTQAGYIEYTDEQDNPSRLIFRVRREELYKLYEPKAETLIQSILRSYTGLFTDYVYINEDLLATRTGLTRQQIYDLLIMLSKQHIVNYIPRKKTTYIIYKCKRVKVSHLQISREVYENRKEKYEERIKAMIEYVTSDTACRSRMLLRYFGEKNYHECGQCDVCRNRKTGGKELPQLAFDSLKKLILQALHQQPLSPIEIARQIKSVDKDTLGTVLQYLIDEKELMMKEGMIYIP